jgi:hypothetical protein
MERAKQLFHRARYESFEPGMESAFSQGLVKLVEEGDCDALSVLRTLMFDRKVSNEIIAEALRWIAWVKQPATHQQRMNILIEALQSRSPSVRDAAGLGIATLDDPAAIPFVQRAITKETIDELRADLTLVLDQLQETQRSNAAHL